MAHPRVEQLRNARVEWLRTLDGLSEDDGAVRLLPMNSISWIAGHMAWHERLYWAVRAEGLSIEPLLDDFASGQPASIPSLAAVQAVWQRVVDRSGPLLDGLTTADLTRPLAEDRRPDAPNAGSLLQYITYHYWAHMGEVSAIRQILGHKGLVEYVSDFPPEVDYRPEADA